MRIVAVDCDQRRETQDQRLQPPSGLSFSPLNSKAWQAGWRPGV